MNQLPPAIILAGGFGTRLKHIIHDVPKPMASVNGRPFLDFVLEYLNGQGIKQVILAVGYQSHTIIDQYQDQYLDLRLQYVIEDKPPGTGGAIYNAFLEANLDKAFIINGDTFFPIDLNLFKYLHQNLQRPVSIALKNLQDFDRYGTVKWNAYNEIFAFKEKLHCQEGWINGGIYLLERNVFSKFNAGSSFSIEKDIFEDSSFNHQISGIPFPDYFIDIGIPEDYNVFQNIAQDHKIIEDQKVDVAPSLFLDRDGVINRRIVDGYVCNWQQFEFLPGSLQAIEKLSQHFDRIFIVTNQQGIGRGLMSETDLETIHQNMLNVIQKHGGRIDKIYHCPDLHINNPPTRKPNVGMALQAKIEFPSIDFNYSFMVGDSKSDLEFGLRAGMKSFQIGISSIFPQIKIFKDLISFAHFVQDGKVI